MAKNFTKLNHKNFPLWKKNIRKNLSIEDKLIYFSLMANPQTDYRGIFEIETDDLIKTGVKIEKIEKAFLNLESHNLIKYDEENGIVLVPEMVKTQKWGQNEILSLINYIKDEIDSFLILDLVSILQLLDLTDKAKGYLSDLQGVSKGYQRGIKGEGVALAIDKNKIRIDKDIESDKKENKNKDLDIKLDKEEKALLEKDAESIYDYYRMNIKGGSKKVTVINLKKFLKDHTKDELLKSIDNYIFENKKSDTDIKYYKKPENFFSNASEVFAGYTGFDALREEKVKEFFNRMESIRDNVFASNEGKVKSLEDARNTYINFLTEEEIEKGKIIITGESHE